MINLTLTEEELRNIIKCCLFENMEREFEKNKDKMLKDIKENILQDTACDIEEQISYYQKDIINNNENKNENENKNDNNKEKEVELIIKMRNSEKENIKFKSTFNINKNILDKAKEFKDSKENIYRLNLGEIIEIALALYLDQK